MTSNTADVVDQETFYRLSTWMLHETGLLDERNLTGWLDLVAADFVYQIPVPVTRDNPELPPYAEDAFLVEETKESIETIWASRWQPDFFEYAWGENPPQRIRRFVTNVRVASHGTEAGVYELRSNVLLSFSRQSNPAVLVPAGRIDLVRERGGQDFELAARTVLLDEPVVRLTHMHIVF
jgi:3-phenylpropionate/cinnamic acid dioxygenase small subunit